MRTFIAYPMSPWSERARFALDHHGVAYREIAYVPMLGAPLLRLATRNFTRPVSAPVLLDGGAVYADSYLIARHAEEIGRSRGSAPLFPDGREEDVREWNARANALSDAGRALHLPRLLADPAARRESVPSWIPGAFARLMDPIVQATTRHVGRKYGSWSRPLDERRADLVAELDRLRAALDGRAYLLGDFSYADVAMASGLAFVRPHERAKLAPAVRAVLVEREIASRYEDLLAWRDAIYARHRRPSARA